MSARSRWARLDSNQGPTDYEFVCVLFAPGSLPREARLAHEQRCGRDLHERSERLVHPASLQLPLLEPQVARKVGIVAANLLDEALGILAAADEHTSSSTPSGKSGESALSTTV